ncbi:hypothetical protein CI238_11295, partial [Colletotrichum incanum]
LFTPPKKRKEKKKCMYPDRTNTGCIDQSMPTSCSLLCSAKNSGGTSLSLSRLDDAVCRDPTWECPSSCSSSRDTSKSGGTSLSLSSWWLPAVRVSPGFACVAGCGSPSPLCQGSSTSSTVRAAWYCCRLARSRLSASRKASSSAPMAQIKRFQLLRSAILMCSSSSKMTFPILGSSAFTPSCSAR